MLIDIYPIDCNSFASCYVHCKRVSDQEIFSLQGEVLIYVHLKIDIYGTLKCMSKCMIF